MRRIAAPVVFVHAENDYSTSPGRALAAERERLGKPEVLKIYPPLGKTADERHYLVYSGVPTWEPDVFALLDANLAGGGR